MTVTELKRPNKQSLGRGLSALLGESTYEPEEGTASNLDMDIHLIRPGKYQPRRRFDDEQLASLIESVKT